MHLARLDGDANWKTYGPSARVKRIVQICLKRHKAGRCERQSADRQAVDGGRLTAEVNFARRGVPAAGCTTLWSLPPCRLIRACILMPTARLLIMPVSWAELVERVTRIELALSAWEAKRFRLVTGLTC